MKEFLDTAKLYTYVKDTEKRSEDWIEIPEGAFSLTKCDDTFLFWNHDQTMCMNPKMEKCFRKYSYDGHAGYFKMNNHTMNKNILWHRGNVDVESEKLDTDAMLADIDVQIATHSQHGHYFKDVRDLNVIDVYQVLRLFNVTDPCLQHIVKKALVAGGRGHKNFERDLKDIHDTSKRALEINNILY